MPQKIKIRFKNDRDIELAGVVELPDASVEGYAIMAHCFACSKDMLAAARISKALTNDNIGVLRFDFTGLGESGGRFKNSTFTTNVQDIVAAADYLRENYAAPKLVVGHSLGGAAAIKAASLIPEITAIATIGAPSDPEHVSHHFVEHIDEIEKKGHVKVMLAGFERTITKEFLEDLKQQDLVEILQNQKKRALLICHSPIDNVVSIDHAATLYVAARHPKSFISLAEADHLVTDKKDASYVANVIGAWAKRYVCES